MMEEEQRFSKKQKIILGIIALVCVLILGEVGYAMFSILNRTSKEDVAVSAESGGEVENDDAGADGYEADQEPKTEADVASLLESGTLMVCVPADTLPLRKRPVVDGAVITELTAGTQVIWDGARMQDGDSMFYRVVVRQTGQQGYVLADYCVPVSFDAPQDLDELPIVETDTALYTYEMMSADIEVLAETYPDIVSWRVAGTSLDDRNIYEVVLGNPNAENHILMQAAIHGREYMTTQLMMKMIEYYAYYYDTGSYHGISYQELMDHTAIHIVPMSNPDGVTISQLGASALNDQDYTNLVYECYERDKYYLEYNEDANGYGNWLDHYSDTNFDRSQLDDQRMITYQEYQQIWKANAAGVDLNNNFDAGWNELDLKEYPSYGNYKGTAAVSEPEAQALVNLAMQRDYQYFISYHSKGQLIYYDVNGNDADTSARSLELANLLKNTLNYQLVNTQKGYNVNLGGFSDWLQLSLKQTSVTIESGRMPCPLSIDEFPGLWYRHRESWAMLMKEICD